jgi:hypothetical protein
MSALPDADVRRWVDTAAITDLISRYSDGVTRADWAQVEAVFAPDSVWESPLLGLRFESARSFLDLLRTSTDNELLIQTVSAPVIRLVGPDRAEATTTVQEIVRGVSSTDSALGPAGSASNFVQYGIYDDEIARLDGEWKFTHRYFVPLYVSPGVVAGQAIALRASLVRIRDGANVTP